MSWPDRLNPTDRAALKDAGRYDITDATMDGAQGNADDYLFHDECGYAWNRHDNAIPGRRLPFGCPEGELVLRFSEGDR